MMDFRGTELSVGDTIVYCVRQHSEMKLKQTTIIKIEERTDSYSNKKYEVAICNNPTYISKERQLELWKPLRDAALKEDPNHWYYSKYGFSATNYPKTVTLTIPAYIVKVD